MKKKMLSMVMCLLLLAGLMSGCSSDSDESKGSGDSKKKEAVVGEDGTDWTEKAEAAMGVTPTSFQGPKEAAGTVPEGKKIALVSANAALQGCVAPLYTMQDICDELGWTYQFYDGAGSSSQQNEMIMNAVSWGADMICVCSVDPATIQQGLKEAADADIVVTTCSTGIFDPNPEMEMEDGQLTYEFGVSPDYAAVGSAIADWIVNDAGNEGEIVIVDANEAPSCRALRVGLLEELKISDMKVDDSFWFTGSQVGDTLIRNVTSYLTKHPDCKYVFVAYDPAAAVIVEGLNQAGMNDVKVISVLGIQQNIEYIREENVQVATAAYDNNYMGYAVIDQYIRYLNGKEYSAPMGENLPYTVLDATNLPEQGTDWTALSFFDYEKEFKALWK
ncbi:sugar ABC transporter substrate-binding protein [Extibacter muris]|uniref:sugar ABC transporter substrate-binding protein n=1 Tax=Extibacter muris TaxID=1796622 RepID=UPI001D07368A|nr:sugar ABC transporter substrate-binding protein [Extibacter muris]MCB6201987.1 substrate-binding domain-containing protein [Extibacter muris]MCQ4663340.1 substrate-binding domain-containing protein [Extibacter muris]MCQ4692620.1 substrate-binding domain-containing protein [Extibacter muris]